MRGNRGRDASDTAERVAEIEPAVTLHDSIGASPEGIFVTSLLTPDKSRNWARGFGWISLVR